MKFSRDVLCRGLISDILVNRKTPLLTYSSYRDQTSVRWDTQ